MRGGRKREDFAEIVDYFAQRAPGAAAPCAGYFGRTDLALPRPLPPRLFGGKRTDFAQFGKNGKKIVSVL